ncbi:MAG: hypothetical protein Q4C49_14580 [Bacillota bacterium]|nr:hypothetical protein [Bacillota bacterium]
MMDIGNLKNNYTYYEGYEGECEIVFFIQDHEEYNLHIWEGYFEEAFGDPAFKENGWIGFTRDYQEGIYAFSDHECVLEDLPNYLKDLRECIERIYDKDTQMCLEQLIYFITFAMKNGYSIVVKNS